MPIAIVAATVALALWTYRGQASPPVDLNDSGLHKAMTDWAADRLGGGHNPFDGWFPDLGLGFPQTHHYQSLPHVLTAGAGLAFGVDAAYHWSLYLLLAGWPIAVFVGARLLGLGVWAGAFAAAVAPWVVSEPGYGFEAGSYTWQGLGLWPQLWAAWLLPIAVGLAWRAIRAERPPIAAGAAIAACTLCHFITGWLALAIICLLPLVEWRAVARRFGRLGLVLASSAAGVAWFVVPMFLDRAGADYTGYERGTFWYDSFGATQVGRWLVSGELLDAGRLPVLTVLAAIGLVVAATRFAVHAGSRVVVLVTALSLVLFAGRPTWGGVLDLLPYGADLFYPRFIIGVHLGGVLLAGIGAAWLAVKAVDALDLFGPRVLSVSLVVAVALVVLAPAVQDGVRREDEGRRFMAEQRRADVADLADLRVLLGALDNGGGRAYAGSLLGDGSTYAIGYVPVYAHLLDQRVDAVGFQLRVSSLATSFEAQLDDTDPVQLAALGVRWLVLPADDQPSVPATMVAQRGDHRLWELEGAPGYIDVVDGTGPVLADDLGDLTAAAIADGTFSATSRPLVDWDGGTGRPTSVTPVAGEPGDVGLVVTDLANGSATAQVVATRDAYVALAASWHPRWQATVDGERTDVVLLAPGVAATRVPPGTHAVSFTYVPFAHTWLLVLAGAIVTGLVHVAPRAFARPRVPSNR